MDYQEYMEKDNFLKSREDALRLINCIVIMFAPLLYNTE